MFKATPKYQPTTASSQSLLLISKAHKLRLKLLISEYRKLCSSAVIGGGGSAEGKGKAKEGIFASFMHLNSFSL